VQGRRKSCRHSAAVPAFSWVAGYPPQAEEQAKREAELKRPKGRLRAKRMIGVTGGATAAVCCFFNSSTRAQRRAPQPRRHAEAQRLML
jgi:hypothetical protein